MKIKLIILYLLSVLGYSCEGTKHCTSLLIDATTRKPVSGATINYLDGKGKTVKTAITDSTGMVIFNSGFTGMNFGGPTFGYQISKTGYEQLNGNEKYPSSELLFKPNK